MTLVGYRRPFWQMIWLAGITYIIINMDNIKLGGRYPLGSFCFFFTLFFSLNYSSGLECFLCLHFLILLFATTDLIRCGFQPSKPSTVDRFDTQFKCGEVLVTFIIDPDCVPSIRRTKILTGENSVLRHQLQNRLRCCWCTSIIFLYSMHIIIISVFWLTIAGWYNVVRELSYKC